MRGIKLPGIHSSVVLFEKVVKLLNCLKCFPFILKTIFGWGVTFSNRVHIFSGTKRSIFTHIHHSPGTTDITYFFFVMRPRWYGWVFNVTTAIIHLSLEQWSGRIAWTPSLTTAWLKIGRKSFVFLPGALWGGKNIKQTRFGGLV